MPPKIVKLVGFKKGLSINLTCTVDFCLATPNTLTHHVAAALVHHVVGPPFGAAPCALVPFRRTTACFTGLFHTNSVTSNLFLKYNNNYTLKKGLSLNTLAGANKHTSSRLLCNSHTRPRNALLRTDAFRHVRLIPPRTHHT